MSHRKFLVWAYKYLFIMPLLPLLFVLDFVVWNIMFAPHYGARTINQCVKENMEQWRSLNEQA